MKTRLHFAHGNGFPSPCYRQLLEGLESQFDCFYIDRVGHSPDFPVTENWRSLVDEVIQSIRSQVSEPVIAVGHSLGGVLSLVAAIEQPSLFKGVILLDSPLLGRVKSSLVRLSKALGIIDRITPAFRTRKRREHWQTREQALFYLKSRALFKSFTDACLDDYIDYGMQKTETGYSLRFDRQVEYQIYRTIPHILKEYEGRLKVPTVLIYGHQSDVIDRSDLRYMKRKYGIHGIETKGTHMFPMEDPALCARLIMDVALNLI
ncbi:MAG: alpha/beta hydrolase [Legionellales bacterium]|nr:alpha/beta hydrolase [Legionellales bacterium]